MPAYHVTGPLTELVRTVAEVEARGETVTHVIEGHRTGGWVVITHSPVGSLEMRGTR